MFIALECFRETKSEACMKLFEKQSTKKQKACGNSMIPSAHVLGTGFIIGKDAVDKTRRKSLVSKLCNKPISYGGFLVPDGISIAEIYDSEAQSLFFSDSNQFLSYLSSTYGVGVTNEEMDAFEIAFNANIPIDMVDLKGNLKYEQIMKNKATNTNEKSGSSKRESTKNIMLSLFEINIIRYALSLEDVKADSLDPFFLIDFMLLPENYFLAEAQQKYEKFIFRYGTHYIHSAEFGGQILFENSRVADSSSDIEDLAQESSREFQSAFGNSLDLNVDAKVNLIQLDAGLKSGDTLVATGGSKNVLNSYKKGSFTKKRNWTNIFLQSQGGDISIAKLVLRLEGNMVGATLSEWLKSIPKHPKAFKLKMKPVHELLNINVRSIFMQSSLNEICRKTKRQRCVYGSNLKEFQEKFDRRRKSLEIAIELYRHKHIYDFSDMEIPAGTPEACTLSIHQKSKSFPTYDEILNGIDFKIIIELDRDYRPLRRGEEIFLMYHNGLWFGRTRDETFNFLHTYKMPKMKSGILPLVIRNLVFHYNDTTGYLKFKQIGHNLESHNLMLTQNDNEIDEHWRDPLMKKLKIARTAYINVLQGIEKALNERFFVMPCNLDWSSANSRRFAVSFNRGKCLNFVAASASDMFVVFATNPHNEFTWYYFQISSYGVALYRAGLVAKYKLDQSVGSLKDKDLFRPFFICMNFEKRSLVTRENELFKNANNESFKREENFVTGLFIQYGIVKGFESHGQVELAFFDEQPLEPRYYTFGSYEAKVSIYDISVSDLSPSDEIKLRCFSNNEGLLYTNSRCASLCHSSCLGCYSPNSTDSCIKCKYAGFYENGKLKCYSDCPRGYKKDKLSKVCVDINECAQRNQTRVIYFKNNMREIYEWKLCAYQVAYCINTPGSYECKCIDGYYGDGFECYDIDECNVYSINCGANAKCVNTPGSYHCRCLDGYIPENSTCVDIDECALDTHECQQFSSCVNIIGSYRCECLQGFYGNGVYCEDINECELKMDKCPLNSICFNRPGSYVCHCEPNYVQVNYECVQKEHLNGCMTKCPFNSFCEETQCKCFDGYNSIYDLDTKLLISCEIDKSEEQQTMCPTKIESSCNFPNDCDDNANCVTNSLNNSYKCVCKDNFLGNGFKCFSTKNHFLHDDRICRTMMNGRLMCFET